MNFKSNFCFNYIFCEKNKPKCENLTLKLLFTLNIVIVNFVGRLVLRDRLLRERRAFLPFLEWLLDFFPFLEWLLDFLDLLLDFLDLLLDFFPFLDFILQDLLFFPFLEWLLDFFPFLDLLLRDLLLDFFPFLDLLLNFFPFLEQLLDFFPGFAAGLAPGPVPRLWFSVVVIYSTVKTEYMFTKGFAVA